MSVILCNVKPLIVHLYYICITAVKVLHRKSRWSKILFIHLFSLTTNLAFTNFCLILHKSGHIGKMSLPHLSVPPPPLLLLFFFSSLPSLLSSSKECFPRLSLHPVWALCLSVATHFICLPTDQRNTENPNNHMDAEVVEVFKTKPG